MGSVSRLYDVHQDFVYTTSLYADSNSLIAIQAMLVKATCHLSGKCKERRTAAVAGRASNQIERSSPERLLRHPRLSAAFFQFHTLSLFLT